METMLIDEKASEHKRIGNIMSKHSIHLIINAVKKEPTPFKNYQGAPRREFVPFSSSLTEELLI